MLNEERRRKILELVQSTCRVLVKEVARSFGTSEITIRKDLDLLARRGLVERTHGGALLAQPGGLLDLALQEKEKLHPKEKARIAAAAARLVQEGQVVILDSGTTTTAIARALSHFKNLMVITNAVNIAAELAHTSAEVILTGGTLHKNSASLVGPTAEESLRKFSADIFFLAADGFDLLFGFTKPNQQEARVNQVMAEISKKTVAVSDSSKFGRCSLARILPVSSIHHLICDDKLPEVAVSALRDAGVEVTLV